MSVSNVDKIQLQIMYLFMNVDGICGEKEYERFEAICDELKASREDKKEIMEFANKIEFDQNGDNSEVVINTIGTLLGYIQDNKSNVEQESDAGNRDLLTALQSFCAATSQLTQNLEKSLWSRFINKSRVKQAHTIWTLINLGYADNMLTSSERRVINYLISVWEVDKTLSGALYDTAETMVALQMKKDWILSTDKAEDEKNILCSDIDTEIKKMFADVELTIAEASI